MKTTSPAAALSKFLNKCLIIFLNRPKTDNSERKGERDVLREGEKSDKRKEKQRNREIERERGRERQTKRETDRDRETERLKVHSET